MEQRVSFDERARVEAMSAEGVEVAEIARRLGRHRMAEMSNRARVGDAFGLLAQCPPPDA